MKKINITITAPDVDIIAEILKEIKSKLKNQDVKMDVSYEDDSVKELMKKQNEGKDL